MILFRTLTNNRFCFIKPLKDASKRVFITLYNLAILGHSINPWYVRDEVAELELLRRHKSFISEIERSSADTWIRSGIFRDFESERDAYLCLSRCSSRPGFEMKCNSCSKKVNSKTKRYRCLDCKDMNLCGDCYMKGEEPNDHTNSHRIVRLR